MAKLFGSIAELVKLVFRADSQSIGVQPNQSTTYTADRDFDLPPGDSSQVLTSADSTQTLTNKTIDGDDNTVQDLPDTAIKTVLANAGKFFTRDGSGIPVSNDKDVPTGDVIGTSDTQTLTNKTIDADSNTISNIDNGEIKVGAAIDAAKIANGSVSNAEFQKLDGIGGDLVGTSDTQTLTNKTIDADNNTISNLAHGAEVDNPSSGVHGVTGSVVGTTDVQTLTQKSLSAPNINGGDINLSTASNTDKIVISKDTTANLALLTREEASIYYDTTTELVVVDDGTALKTVGPTLLDEDNMVSDSATDGATQQSIKAYVDNEIAGIASAEESIDNAAGSTSTTLGDADDNINVFTPSSAIVVTLDNSYTAGRTITIINNGTAAITVDANDSSAIAEIQEGASRKFICTTSSPADSTDWTPFDTPAVYQVKTLASDVGATGSIGSFATTLTVGKTYRFILQIRADLIGASALQMEMRDNTTVFGFLAYETDATISRSSSNSYINTMANTNFTVNVTFISAGGTTIRGNGSQSESFLIIEEMPNTVSGTVS